MKFHLKKSTQDNSMGMIHFNYRTIPEEGEVSKKLGFSLGIPLTVDEWDSYSSGDYDPDVVMPSLGITYSKFCKFMKVMEDTVNANRKDGNIKFILQSTMMKLIADNLM